MAAAERAKGTQRAIAATKSAFPEARRDPVSVMNLLKHQRSEGSLPRKLQRPRKSWAPLWGDRQ